MTWRGDATPNAESADPTREAPARPGVRRRVERVGLVGVPVAAGVYVLLLAAARWPEYWAWIAREQTPMTWLSSMMLLASAAAALLMVATLRLRGSRRGPGGMRPWLLVAAGFGFLGLDERFALHERVRDGFLAPRDMSLPFLPWMAPGDFVLLAYAGVGLALLPILLRAFTGDRRARGLFLAGVVLAAGAVAGDSFDVGAMSTMTEIRVQTAEEIVELASATCFLLAAWLRLVHVLDAADGERAIVDMPDAVYGSAYDAGDGAAPTAASRVEAGGTGR